METIKEKRKKGSIKSESSKRKKLVQTKRRRKQNE